MHHHLITVRAATCRCACVFAIGLTITLACCTAPTPPIQARVLYSAQPSISHADPPAPHTPITKPSPHDDGAFAEKAALPLAAVTGAVAVIVGTPLAFMKAILETTE